MPGPIEVFISYALEDDDLRIELERHLSVLKRRGLIRAWHLGKVEPGQGFRTAIDSHVSTAQLILLLVSASFIDSDDCHDNEMLRALERWQRGEAQVVPILLRPCNWELTHLRRLQPLPDNRRPVTSGEWYSREQAWDSVVRGVHRAAELLAQRVAAARPGSAVLPLRPPFTVPDLPEPAPRASAPSYPGPYSPRAPAPACPDARASYPSTLSYPSDARASYPSTPSYLSAPRASRPSAPSYPERYSPFPAPASSPVAASAPGRTSDPTPFSSWPPRGSMPEAQPASGAPGPSQAQPIDGSRRSLRGLSRWIALACFACANGLGMWGYTALWPSGAQEDPVPIGANRADVVVPTTQRSGVPAAEKCGPACCGGMLCAVSDQNTGRQVCYGGETQCKPCTSGRTCIPFTCDTRLDPNRRLLLRLADAKVGSRYPSPEERVCVRRHASHDAWTCTPYGQAADRQGATPASGMSTRLEVTTADLLEGRGIDIRIEPSEGEPPRASLVGTAHRSDIKVTALCRGLVFPPSNSADPNPDRVFVVFYLDDPP